MTKCQQPCSWKTSRPSTTSNVFKTHFGKLPNWPRIFVLISLLAAHTGPGPTPKVPATYNHTKPLLHILDEPSDTYYLVDTGAEVSNVRPRGLNRPPGLSLVAANGRPIKNYGSRTIVLKINGSCYTWSFHVADVHKSILGDIFLRSHGLLVDLANRTRTRDSRIS